MLVIGRKIGEGLRIGRDVTILVQDIRGSHVKLSISAPASVDIARAELGTAESLETAGRDTPESPEEVSGGANGHQP